MENEKTAALKFLKDFKDHLLIQTVEDVSIKSGQVAAAFDRFEKVRGKADQEIQKERLNELMKRIADLAGVLSDSEKLMALTAIITALEE